jgi:hypothetical protein
MDVSNKINNSMSNIIQFPTSISKSTNPNLTDADRDLLLLKEKIQTTEAALEYVTTETIGMVHRLGFDISQEDFIKDVTLIVDSVRGLMYRSSGLESPIHKFVDETYKWSEEGTDRAYAYNPDWHTDDDIRHATVDEDGNFIETDENGNPLEDK